jgi:hypothetical protein
MSEDTKTVSHSEARRIAELEVRRYFDTYLTTVFPGQVASFITAHTRDPDAHGGVEKRFNRLIWVMVGIAGAGGGGLGFGLQSFLM